MKAENICIQKEIHGQPVIFEFRPMGADEAALFIGRIKARGLYFEKIRKEIEIIEGRPEIPADVENKLPAVPATPGMPIHLIDDQKYLALLEKREMITRESVKVMAPLFQRFEKPSEAELVTLSEEGKNFNVIMDVLLEIFSKMLPSEEARKKS